MSSEQRRYTHDDIEYLHEKYDTVHSIIWHIPGIFGVDDVSVFGFEVLHERTLRFGKKAYELAGLHARILNAVIVGTADNRAGWLTHRELYGFLNAPRSQTAPIHPTYISRALKAYDNMMRDATGTDEPFFERGPRGTGHPIRLRLNPIIGIEDRRTPRDYDLPFD
jgi:hypothetical protein